MRRPTEAQEGPRWYGSYRVAGCRGPSRLKGEVRHERVDESLQLGRSTAEHS